jgi:Mrp family chromosome partitioning ATPase
MTMHAFIRRWWLLVLLPAIGLLIAGLSSAMSHTQYQSVVTVQLNPAAKSPFLPYSPQAVETQALVASYQEVLRSRAFAETVVQRLNLPLTPDAVARSINTAPVANTNILRLIVTAARPDDAQRLAQAIAEFFVSDAISSQGSPSGAQSRLAEMEETARSYPARIEAIRQQRDRLDQAAARGDTSRLTELNNLDARLTSMETSYASLLVEINRTRSSTNTASILDNATPGVATGATPLSRALPFGLAIGVGLATGLIFLLERFEDTLRTPSQVTAVVGQPPLTVVGRVPSSQPPIMLKDSSPPVDGQALALHAIHMLRGNVQLAGMDRSRHTLLVTSASPGEGKTFIACNLAVAHAQAGERVLLVDADLRAPSLHTIFDVSNASGYLDALSAIGATPCTRYQAPNGQPAVEAMFARAIATAVSEERPLPGIVPSGIENLSLLVAGPAPDDPAAVLGAPASLRLVEELGARWDLVIFDTTPILPVSDTRTLALAADTVLLVVRSGVSRRTAVSETLEILRQPGRPRLDVVLNDYEPPRLPARGSSWSLSRSQ